MSDTAIDRFIYYHPDLSHSLGLTEPSLHKDKIAALLEETSEFLHRHELRPSSDKSISMDSQATHTVYGGSVRTWFCSVSGKFKIDTCESVSRLCFLSGQLFRAGCPLFLVECRRPDLLTFPLYFDIDISVSEDSSDIRSIEKDLLGSDESGYPLLTSIVRILYSVYSSDKSLGDLFVSSATCSGQKISWRLVFPNLIVNAERLAILRDYIVQKLNQISTRKDEKILKEFKDRLAALSPSNSFRTIIDESAAKSRHGIRMVFNDKVTTTDGKLEMRPFSPLIHLSPQFENEKFSKFVMIEETASAVGDMEWGQKNSLLWPFLTHKCLSEWTHQPAVRSSANIRTGPGGSSLCLSSMTVGDAVRAASRFQARQASDKRKNFSAIYNWEEGTVASFKKRLPIGIAGKFEDTESKSTWTLQSDLAIGNSSGSRSSVSFDETTGLLTVISIDNDEFKYLTRMISRRFPNVQPTAPQLATAADPLAAPEEKKQKIFVVLKTYRGEEPGELDVDEGEHVELVNHDASGWSAVKSVKTGKLGYVPATFIREIE